MCKIIEPSLLEIQNKYIETVKKWNAEYKEKHGHSRKMYCVTMGCQMNAHDSEKLKGMLLEMGYEEADNEDNADFVIYNTCCIRANAEEKVYGKLGWLKNRKRKEPELIVAICGCMTQQDTVIEKIHKTYNFVDIIFGTFNLYKLPELLVSRIESGSEVCDIWKEHGEIVEDLPTVREHKYKSSVNIMYGCNNFCTYCIVPYVRGRERSREVDDILKEIKELVSDGVKEVMLLGQNVNSYGKTLENPESFAELLRKINEIDGLERIRFMTSHPKDLSDELIDAMRDCDKVCKYLHLPVQSGSSKILEKMNRRYTKEKYLELVDKIKAEIPDIMLSTDIIVGFPGETEEDFQETLDIIKKVKYSTAFTFIYSKRTGTPAATMEDQIPEDIVKDRFDRMLHILNPIIHEVNNSQVGKVIDVLVEEVSKNDEKIMTGRGDNNSLIHFEGSKDLIGQIIKVKIIDNKTFYLIGERI